MVSRVASNPVNIPASVNITIDGLELTVKGANVQLEQSIHHLVSVKQEEQKILFSPVDNSIEANALAGTMRSLVNNMVIGVTEGFVKKLVLKGVGYRAKAQGKNLDLAVGLSHPVNIPMPDGVTVETPSNTEIVLKGANKQEVSQVAANIRAVRPPEPYKGKGIRYENEQVMMKEGKKK